MTDYTSLNLARCALVVIDVQADFVDGAMPVPGTAELLPVFERLVQAFRAAERPIAHVIRFYEPGGSDVDTVRRASIEAGAVVAAPGTAGSRIPARLTDGHDVELDHRTLVAGGLQHLGPQEVVMFKPRWSAFHRTALQTWLEQHAVDSVVVAGCNLPNCPRATLFDAAARDYRTAVVTDAVSQVTEERLADLRLIGVNLVTTSELEELLSV
ncbi:Nicotinamidase-related amidase [Quadrisphaera granulorum]|uniref:Nicotinamidase-related amidase n=1 Tax=Quadrisphaera granulorum TaxID=317664 RepID=A0A316AAY1_9ACTN|nr:nicotinamidase-related amidase [Quadrisphaera granulorum]SZE95881.1 Nicotinamidase-related amidase [Quadrisphaera granulorum]